MTRHLLVDTWEVPRALPLSQHSLGQAIYKVSTQVMLGEWAKDIFTLQAVSTKA